MNEILPCLIYKHFAISKDKEFIFIVRDASIKFISNIEPALAQVLAGESFQFERLGYFCADMKDFSQEHPVFNRTVTLRDTWQKLQKKN